MSKNYRAHLDWAKCHLDGNLTWVLGKGQARQITRMYISVITILIYGHLWAVFMINVYPDMVKVCNSHHTFWEWPKRLSYGMMNVWKRPMSILYSLKLNLSFVLHCIKPALPTCVLYAILYACRILKKQYRCHITDRDSNQNRYWNRV